jgi:hypothetical protein
VKAQNHLFKHSSANEGGDLEKESFSRKISFLRPIDFAEHRFCMGRLPGGEDALRFLSDTALIAAERYFNWDNTALCR